VFKPDPDFTTTQIGPIGVVRDQAKLILLLTGITWYILSISSNIIPLTGIVIPLLDFYIVPRITIVIAIQMQRELVGRNRLAPAAKYKVYLPELCCDFCYLERLVIIRPGVLDIP
jgi:hypothetical protein